MWWWLQVALFRRQVTLRDIQSVTTAARFGGPDKLQQIYEWHNAEACESLIDKKWRDKVAKVTSHAYLQDILDEVS